ncbi:MAG: hypothetical protein IPM42_11075 [Saprospiraceae bacterium]|nr:hypothetical protein [Saprospiraceae bacterium]
MIRILSFAFMFTFFLGSCTEPDEEILPLVGIYRTHILGVTGPFDLIITTDRGSNIFIEAPFDGFEWYIIKAKVQNADESIKDIQIKSQNPDCCMEISGKGFYLDRSIELNYTVIQDGRKRNLKIIGTKL